LSKVENRQGSKRVRILPLILLAVISTLSILLISYFKPNSSETISTAQPPPRPISSLAGVRERGTLRVLTRNTLSTYFEGPTGPAGFEYELLESFAEKLGVELEIHVTDQVWSILDELESGNYDLAAANITVTADAKSTAEFGWPYLETVPQVVFRSGNTKPENIEDLINHSVVAIRDSNHLTHLGRLKERNPALTWAEIDDDVDLLVRLINDGDADYGILDSVDTMTEKRLFPELRVGFDLEREPLPVAWAYPKNTDRSLLAAADEHLQEFRTYGRLEALKKKYYDRTNELDFFSTRAFVRDIKELLPTYREFFEEAGSTFGVEWQLLAAMSYQESHWKADAISPTGVEGIMMLTNKTAAELEIQDRTDPYSSIMGGAEYFAGIHRRLPDSLEGTDRRWVAVAAYNIGIGHIYDVRRLLKRQGKNADSWAQIEKHLPLLTNPQVYETLKYGYARGNEPVTYVRNIKLYYETLIWETAPDVPPQANYINRNTEQENAVRIIKVANKPIPLSAGPKKGLE